MNGVSVAALRLECLKLAIEWMPVEADLFRCARDIERFAYGEIEKLDWLSQMKELANAPV